MNNGAHMSFDTIQEWFNEHKQYAYIVAGSLALAGIGGFYYWNQKQKTYTAAYTALVQGYADLAKAYEDPQMWDDVQLTGRVGSDTYGSTVLAPYFDALEVEASIQLGDLDGALNKIDGLIKGLSRSNPLYYPFKIKQAQMQISHENEAIEKQGLSALQKLAEDTNNPQRDEALFYAGYHYWLTSDKAKAFYYWRTLRDDFAQNQQIPSPWVQIIQDFAFDTE